MRMKVFFRACFTASSFCCSVGGCSFGSNCISSFRASCMKFGIISLRCRLSFLG